MRTALIAFAFSTLWLPCALAEDCAVRLKPNSQAKDVIACLQEQADVISALRQNLLSWKGDQPVAGNEVGSGDPRSPTMCPAGYYVAGLNWWGAPSTIKFCIGCVNGLQVICRQLNAK